MAKQGQRRVDTSGRNDPGKSQDMTTGAYKKPETYREQAARREDPDKAPPITKAPHDQPHQDTTLRADSRAQTALPRSRSGSDSNARNGRKARDMQTSHSQRQPAGPAPDADDFDRDLHPDFLAGQNTGLDGSPGALSGRTAHDHKDAYALLRDFTDDELRAIPILPTGTRLEQGATYLDLAHRERGPLTAMAGMEAESRSLYVPKKLVDYVSWNRLTGVTDPDRLDEASGGNC